MGDPCRYSPVITIISIAREYFPRTLKINLVYCMLAVLEIHTDGRHLPADLSSHFLPLVKFLPVLLSLRLLDTSL